MDVLHGAGMLVRDFTANNLMILPSGEVRLIDLELAHPLSDGAPLSWGAGTPGFFSPEQATAQPSTFADEYYALGATIAYLATGVVPYLLSDSGGDRPLGERLREWITAAERYGMVATTVCDLVLGCMADDPAKRWGPGEVPAAIEAPGPSACRHKPPMVSDAKLARAVEDMGRWLARTIDPAGQHLWPTSCLGLNNDPCNVHAGASGVGLFLCRAIEAGGDPALRDLLATTATWVSALIAASPERPPGLYFGLAGAAWVLAEDARWLDDPTLTDRATALALSVPTFAFTPDITHGTAGLGLAQLHHWDLTGDARFLERARAAADALAAGARSGEDGLAWGVDDEADSRFAGSTFYGFAHGSAGIVYFLLSAAAALDEPSYRELALEGLETLMRLAQGSDRGATRESSAGPSPFWPPWCHGS